MESQKLYWDIAVSSFGNADVTDKWWTLICSNYNSNIRVYHNNSYLSSLFKFFEEYKDTFSSSNSVILAIFFHKLEYNPKESKGEKEGLEEFNKFADEISSGDEVQTDLVANTRILLESCCSNLTEAHMTPGASAKEDQHYLLDMTMAALGASPQDYSKYASDIQTECEHLGKEAYTQLRLKVLQSLLMIPNVYATKEFQEKYEKQARENIAAEIEKLKKSSS